MAIGGWREPKGCSRSGEGSAKLGDRRFMADGIVIWPSAGKWEIVADVERAIVGLGIEGPV